jgi:hypothetical protein
VDSAKRKTYREISVWRRIDEERAVRFRYFEELESHPFCVQSADFYSMPLKMDVAAHSDRQFLELFIEEEPAERSGGFPSVEEAIAAHEKEFGSMGEAIARLKTEKNR